MSAPYAAPHAERFRPSLVNYCTTLHLEYKPAPKMKTGMSGLLRFKDRCVCLLPSHSGSCQDRACAAPPPKSINVFFFTLQEGTPYEGGVFFLSIKFRY